MKSPEQQRIAALRGALKFYAGRPTREGGKLHFGREHYQGEIARLALIQDNLRRDEAGKHPVP